MGVKNKDISVVGLSYIHRSYYRYICSNGELERAAGCECQLIRFSKLEKNTITRTDRRCTRRLHLVKRSGKICVGFLEVEPTNWDIALNYKSCFLVLFCLHLFLDQWMEMFVHLFFYLYIP